MALDLLEYHQWCIADPVAMSAYRDAISRVVQPGDVVLDLGAGTGILGYQACAAGASKVYAVDSSEIIALIPQIAADNGFGDRVCASKSLSFDVELPEKADVMIASGLASAGIGNNMLAAVLDARRRLLKPVVSIIPSTLQPCFCPVELPQWYESKIDCWNHRHLDFTFRVARAVAVNQMWACRIVKESLLAVPQPVEKIRLGEITSADVAAKISFRVERPGMFHALAGWVEVTMLEGIRCTNSPLHINRMPWDQLLLPIDSPTAVQAGDQIAAKIRSVSIGREVIFTWDVWLHGTDGNLRAEFHHSNFQGILLTKQELAKRASGYVPMLSETGNAKLTVLKLCDGKLSLDEIAANTLELFPHLLTNLRNARTFTAEVLEELNTALDSPSAD